MSDEMETRPVIPDSDFDHHSTEHAADPSASYKKIRRQSGVVRTSAHGGYWVFTRYGDIASAGKDHVSLSSALHIEGSEEIGGGITLPHNPAATRMSLAEMDPPEWNHVRRALNPTLSPHAVEQFVPRIREITTFFIDRFIETGHCDLVTDICSPIPAVVTLMYLGLPTHEWERFAIPIHSSVYTPREPGHPEFEHLLADSLGSSPPSEKRSPFAAKLLVTTSFLRCSHATLMASRMMTEPSSRRFIRCWLQASTPRPRSSLPPSFI